MTCSKIVLAVRDDIGQERYLTALRLRPMRPQPTNNTRAVLDQKTVAEILY